MNFRREVEELLTAEELARTFKVRKKTLYVWVSRREIPFVKLPGNTTRFPLKAVKEWLSKRCAKGKGVEKGVYL